MRRALICLAVGYGCGCFLSAAFAGRRRGVSIFQVGSGNPGMANAMRCFGFGTGMAVLAGDILKTVAAWLVTALLFGRTAAVAGFTALGAVLGHNFPFWHRFKGGKGVAVTCSGVVLMLPGWGFAALLAGAAAGILTHYLCVGAVVIPAVFIAPAALTAGPAAGWTAAAMTALAVAANWKSLVKLVRGTEAQVDVIGLIGEKIGKNKKS